MLGEIAENNPAARRNCQVCTGPILDGCECEGVAARLGQIGVILIRQERERQTRPDGRVYTPEHDDQHNAAELACAARCYAWHAITTLVTGRQCSSPPPGWPFESAAFKAENPLRALVKAGALIAAEIDRLARANPELLD